MFENIKPSELIHTIALPGQIARKLHEVYAHGDIGDTDIIIEGNHGGYRCVHEPHIYAKYGPLQKSGMTNSDADILTLNFQQCWILNHTINLMIQYYLHLLKQIFLTKISGN